MLEHLGHAFGLLLGYAAMNALLRLLGILEDSITTDQAEAPA